MLYLFFIIIILLIFIGIFIFLATHLFCWVFFGVPFTKTSKKVLQILDKEIDWEGVKKFYDLGSGNGDIIRYLAPRHPETDFIGYEINFLRVWKSRLMCRRKNARFLNKNFFQADLKKADVVFVFLFPEMMDKLISKLEKELNKDVLIISNTFLFSKKIKPIKTFGLKNKWQTVYFYQLP